MQIAPKNMFRYRRRRPVERGHRKIAYKKLSWRKAAIMMDDYSFGWTSRRRHDRRLLCSGRPDHEARVPAAEHDRLRTVRTAAPPPNQVDGYFWVVGGAGTASGSEGVRAGLRQAPIRRRTSATCSSASSRPTRSWPRGRRRHVGGFGNNPGVHYTKVDAYRKYAKRIPGPERGRRVLLQLLHGGQGARRRPQQVGGAVGAKLRRRCRARSTVVPDLQRRNGQARLPPPGDQDKVPAPARQERRRVGRRDRRSRTCRPSISRSAVSSNRRARPQVARSPRARS